MITIQNQIVLQFSIGQFADFIAVQDFRGMRIIENAGGLRPILELRFLLTNTEILPYINQGNIISLRYGITNLSEDVLQFEIQGDIDTPQYKLGSEVCILGAMYNPAFIGQQGSQTIKGKSFEVLQQLCTSSNMKFKTNVQRTNDNQVWTQDGKNIWNFTTHIATRAYKDNSTFFSYGFDNNNYYFYDVKDLFSQGAKWLLACQAAGKDENSNVVNIGTYIPDGSLQGQMAQMAGKNVNTVGFNVDEGEFVYPKHKLKTFTTLDTNSVNINATNCKNYNYMITSGTDHGNTLEAINQNRRNNTLFSSYVVRVPIPGQYRDFRLLDTVQLIPAQKDPQSEGLYVITGIVREISNNMYSTNLTLNRESANGIKGDLVQGEK